jgi:ribonuclease BN (tRNA processing enzyme)
MVVLVRLTVLGACGAWPEPGQACSGFLVEHDGFRLLVDAGYATVPRLLERVAASQVDAVFISYGHPDHCADLNPLLRARLLGDEPAPPLPVYALPGALDAVLALDGPDMLAGAFTLRELAPDRRVSIGPFGASICLLPHWVPNAGLRLAAGGTVLAYTGDSGPDPAIISLARDADLLLAEATYAGSVPPRSQGFLSSAAQAGRQAAQAGVAHLALTHLWPGTSHDTARTEAAAGYHGQISVAAPGLSLELG